MSEKEKIINQIKKTVVVLQELIKDPELIEMKEKNYEEFYQHMKNDIVPCFASLYPTIFELTIMGKDMSNLDVLLNLHKKAIKKNLTGEQRDDYVGREFAKRI